MAVRIRLRRIGKNPKKKPHFRISVFDERSGRDSRCIEELGFYSPVKGTLNLRGERLDYWVKNGAQISESIKSIIKKSKKEK